MADPQHEDLQSSAGFRGRLAAGVTVLFVASAAVPGCSGPTRTDGVPESVPERRGGIVDASLPAAERDRREVVQRLLLGIVAGNDIALVAHWLPGVEFREPPAVFFNGNLLLRRWDFTASRRPGVMSVVLEFVPADDAVATSIEQRTYEVTGRRGAWVVDRVAIERVPP